MILRLRSLVPTLACIAGLAAADPAVVSEAITVEADAEAATVTGTKTETPPLLQPQSIGLVSGDLMRQRHAVKLEDAIQNVAGVTIGGYYGDWDYFRIRGFDAADSVRLDGLYSTPGIWINEEVYGLDRVEVVKGPAAMLYGRTALGGMVNMVSKKPEAKDFAKATVAAGSYGFAELGGDAGAASADGSMGFRLVAMGRNRGSFVDGVDDSRRLYAAPSFTWWGDRTTFTVLGHVIDDDINASWPLPAAGFITDSPHGDIPRERNIGEPDFQNHVERRRLSVGYELEHRFDDAIVLRQNARVSHYESWFEGIYASYMDPDGRTLNRSVYGYESERVDAQADTMLDVRIDSGRVRQDLLFGVELSHGQEEADGTYAAIGALDVFDPVYGQQPGPFTPYTSPDVTTRGIGVYAQDQITIARDLAVTVGLRWDRIDGDNTERLTDTTTTSRDQALTWRVGAAWQFERTASVFASYSTAFAPQPYDKTVAGDVVDPETGDQIEVGLRALDPEGRFAGNLAVYQITRRDVATADLLNPGYSVITGEQRSRGLDLDGRVRPIEGLELTGTYAYIRAEVTKDNSLPVGDRLRNVPDHSVTAWAKYTLQDGALEGLGFGLGGRWYSSQAGDLPNTFELPSYAVVDAALYYDRGPLSAQFNVYNLFDETYAVGSYNDLYVQPGDPLTVRGSVSYTF